MTDETKTLFDSPRWERHDGETVVECPSCGFCFLQDHMDEDGGYTCPLCETTRSHLLVQKAHKWLGMALEQRKYRGDMGDAEGLIEDAWAALEEELNPRPSEVARGQ